ncbi:hypothetical protein AC1031_003210 [Aphanomyces cochlioides]|nr:hypothetical protein AC1031_003210 [Aphanomyces cochlioides]
MGASQSRDFLIDFQVVTSPNLDEEPLAVEWCRCSVKEQTLEMTVDDGKSPPKTLDVRHVHINHIDGYRYELRYKDALEVVLLSPSRSHLDAFLRVLDLASASKKWTLPTTAPQTALFGVAVAIAETHAAKPVHDLVVSNMTVAKVQAHLAEMQAMYKTLTTCNSKEDVYTMLLELEAAYVVDKETANFAHVVHKLHPRQYEQDQELATASLQKKSLRDIFQSCPSCEKALPIAVMYAVHMLGKTVECPRCATALSYEAFHVAQLIDMGKIHFCCASTASSDAMECVLKLPNNSSHYVSLKRFMDEVKRRGLAEGINLSAEDKTRFSLDLVHAMVRQLSFLLKVCSHGDYWSQRQVVAAAIVRYHKFMHLMRTRPKTMLVPTVDIDLVWHAHQCFPKDYALFCHDLVHKLVDHDDTITGGDLQAGYATTFATWAHSPEHSDEKTWRLPSRDCRFVGVDEMLPIDDRGVFVSVIGTLVFDGRVIPTESRQAKVVQSMEMAPIASRWKIDWTVPPPPPAKSTTEPKKKRPVKPQYYEPLPYISPTSDASVQPPPTVVTATKPPPTYIPMYTPPTVDSQLYVSTSTQWASNPYGTPYDNGFSSCNDGGGDSGGGGCGGGCGGTSKSYLSFRTRMHELSPCEFYSSS